MAGNIAAGTLDFPDGGHYQGWIRDGQPQGWGTYTRPDGYTFYGRYDRGLRQGPGTEKLPSGDVTNGFWEQDQPTGEQAVTLHEGGMVFYQYEEGVRQPDEHRLTQSEAELWMWKKISSFDRTVDKDAQDKMGKYLKFHTTVRVPFGVETIPKERFYQIHTVERIYLPDTLQTIEEKAFCSCSGLREINFPEGLKEIGPFAFFSCIRLERVELPDSLVKIGDSAFNMYGNEHITEILLPDNITLGIRSFAGEYLTNLGFKSEHPVGINAGYFAFWQSGNKEDRFGKLTPECIEKLNQVAPKGLEKAGCYVATCVYGSYDCPEVWALRRYRDGYLQKSVWGRAFVRAYYAVGPFAVAHFGETKWFKALFRRYLDKRVKRLVSKGYSTSPYRD